MKINGASCFSINGVCGEQAKVRLRGSCPWLSSGARLQSIRLDGSENYEKNHAATRKYAYPDPGRLEHLFSDDGKHFKELFARTAKDLLAKALKEFDPLPKG